jgi:hypothetical protein
MRFKKGNKTGKGRPKGALNKTSASVVGIFLDVFESIGGYKEFALWATKSDRNKFEFYKMFSKLIPSGLKAELYGDTDGDVEVIIRHKELQDV